MSKYYYLYLPSCIVALVSLEQRMKFSKGKHQVALHKPTT